MSFLCHYCGKWSAPAIMFTSSDGKLICHDCFINVNELKVKIKSWYTNIDASVVHEKIPVPMVSNTQSSPMSSFNPTITMNPVISPNINPVFSPNINPIFRSNINPIAEPTTNEYMDPIINNNPRQSQAAAAAHVVLNMSPSEIYVLDGIKYKKCDTPGCNALNPIKNNKLSCSNIFCSRNVKTK